VLVRVWCGSQIGAARSATGVESDAGGARRAGQLGVATLLSVVALPLAAAHQAARYWSREQSLDGYALALPFRIRAPSLD